ncbi:MAG: hypothetical protein J3R72DRAFT_435743 [Linnemannia gamsii]|nr:MAG: hypothetical protein J3R72DRAFT_435743 [Linnemannia gamsii]
MYTAKRLFLSFAPLMLIECLPLILVTAIYELDILRYLFFGHPTRPIPPSRRKLDSIGFLPIPEKAKSWQGSLVAIVCGLIWFFSEFTLDIILIVLGVDSAADVEKKLLQHKEQQEQLEVTHNNSKNDNDDELVVEECMEEEINTKKTHHFHHHYHHHHHHEIYEGLEASFVEHQPQQQHGGGEWNWRRESQREDESAYDGSEDEGDDAVELDPHVDLLAWKSMERSVEFEEECEALFAVSAAQEASQDEEQKGAVLSSTVIPVKDLQEKEDTLRPVAEYRLLPAQDLESKANDIFVADMNADTDDDADVDTEAADEPLSASSSPLSSTSTSCTNLHTDTEEQQQVQAKDDFTGNTKVWVQLSVSTKAVEAPTLDDCRTNADAHYFHHKQQRQQQHYENEDDDEDDQVSGVSVYTAVSVEQSKDQWSMWGPRHLSRAVKTVQSIQQRQEREERNVTFSPSDSRHLALFPPLSPLAAESAVELLSDDDRVKEAKKKALRYGKKKKAAKKARKASPSDGAGSPAEVDRLSA